MATKAPIYTDFDHKLLVWIESGCNTAKELTIELDAAAKPFVSRPGEEFRVVDRRLQALRKKGRVVWGRHVQNVVWRITKSAKNVLGRETDLHYAFGCGQEFVQSGNAVSVRALFESEFGTHDIEAVEQFNKGIRHESLRIESDSNRQVSAALAAEVKRLQQFVKNAERYARLQDLHDGRATEWHVRGADGEPICVGGLNMSIDETFVTVTE